MINPSGSGSPDHTNTPNLTVFNEEAQVDDSLDPETERILQFVACDMVIPRSPYRGSVDLTNALRKRIRQLIEEARESAIRTTESAWRTR